MQSSPCDQSAAKAPAAEKKPGLFQRIVQKLDDSLKRKAEEKPKGGSCCGDGGKKGGKCC